jgi:hypothetical protein
MKKILDSDVGKVLLGVLALTTLSKKIVIGGAAGLIAYDIGKTQNAAPGSSTSRVKDMNITTKLFKARTEEYKIIAASNKTRSEIDKLKDKFDLERVGLTAALNAATDEETKLRIRGQLAILDNNEALAKKLNAELESTKATQTLASAMNTTAAMILTAGQKVLLGLGVSPGQMSGSAITNGTGLAASPIIPQSNLNFGTSADAMGLGLALGFTPGSRSSQPQEIVITVDTTTGGDRLSQAIAETIQIATKNGFSTVPAGQGFG